MNRPQPLRPRTLASRIRRSALGKMFTGLAAVVLFAGQSVMGATLYWDTNGTTAGAGTTTTGNWNTSNFWSSDSAGTTATGGYTAGSDVVFGAGTDSGLGTITLGANQSVASLAFEEGTTTLTGNTLTFSGTGLSTATGTNSFIASIISGAFTKTGNGTLTITGTQSGGTITVSGGTLIIGAITGNDAINPGAGGIVVNSGARLIKSSGADDIQNTTVITVNSGGVFDTGGVNDSIGAFAGAGRIFGGGTWTATTTGNFSGSLYGGTALTVNGATASQTLSGANYYTGATTIGTTAGSILTLNHALAAQASKITVSAANGLKFGTASSSYIVGGIAGASTFALQDTAGSPAAITLFTGMGNAADAATMTISGSGSLVKVGTGAMTLTGGNTYVGDTVVAGGSLIADTATNATILNSATDLNFIGSGTFQLKGLAATVRSQTVASTTLTAGAATVDVNNPGTSTTLNLGAVTRTAGATVNFNASAGTLGTTAIIGIGAGNTNDATGILGAWATANGTNWAINNGSNQVALYTGYTDVNRLGGVIADAGTSNVRLIDGGTSGNVTLAISGGVTNANTLLSNATGGAVTVAPGAGNTLRLGAVGGVLLATGGSALSIGASANDGALTAGGADNTAGELILNNASANALTVASTIADNGTGVVALTKSGTGTLSLTGTNTYSGVTTLNQGITNAAALANVNTASALGKGSAGGSAADLVFNGGTLQYNSAAATSTDRLFTLLLGGATLDSSNATAANTVSFTGTGSIATAGAGPRTLTLTGTNTGTNLFAPVLADQSASNPTSLTKTGAGTWVLTGANTYTGPTTVSAGILQIGNGGTTGSIANTGVINATGGTVAFARTDTVTLTAAINAGTIRQASTGTLELNNNASTVTTLAFNGVDGGVIDLLADLAINNSGGNGIVATNSGTINATGGGRLIINSTNGATDGQDWGAAAGKTLTINAVIANGRSNNLDIYQNNSTGVTVLTADNTFTGQISIQGNILQVSKIGNQGVAGNAGAGTTIGMSPVAANVGLRYTGTGETNNRIISLFGTTGNVFIEQAGTGLLKFTTNFATPGAGAKTLTLQGSTAGTGEISGVIIDNSANVNTTGIIKTGTGTWTLSGANTYTGATTVSNGKLILGNALAVQNSVVTSNVANNGTTGIEFAPSIGSFSLGGLGGSQNLALTDSGSVALTALTLGGTNTSGGTYSGVLSGSAAITKAGPSTQTLTGVNTITGKVTITGGILALNSEAALGPNPGASTADQLLLNGGAIGAASNAVFTIDDANRGITVGASGGTFDAAAGATMTVAKSIAGGTNTVTKSGAGVVIFTADNTYGATNITGGRLILSGSGDLGSGTVTLNGGGLVISGAQTLTIGAAATGSSLLYTQASGAGTDVSGTLTLTNGGTLFVDVVNSAASVTFATSFGSSTTAGLTKVGNGTLILSPATTGNTYTGTTTAGAGTLRLSFGDGTTIPATNIIASTSALAFQGGTLNLNGMTTGTPTVNAQTFASTSVAAGGSTLSATLGTATSVTGNLGVLTRTTGASLHFAMPNTTTTQANISTTVNNSAGILGGWATYGTTAGVATGWAAKDGSNNVIALASYTTLTAAIGTSSGANANFTMGANVTLSGAGIVANTLRVTAASTLALGTFNASFGNATGGISSNIGAGGIMYSATTGTGTISGTTGTTSQGFISVPTATSDLPIYVSTGGTLTISAGIGGTATAFGITKSGGGTLSLTNNGTVKNNFTGAVVINGGVLSIDAQDRISSVTNGVTLNGGTLTTTSNFTMDEPLTLGLNGGGLRYTGGSGNGGWGSTTAIVMLGSGSRSLTITNDNDNRLATLSAAIGESGGPTSLTIAADNDPNIVVLSGANSTYTGSTTINRGVLRLNAAGAIGGSNVVFNGGTNRAILELTSAYGSFTYALGTAPGQVSWATNASGGFSGASSGVTFVVNLGGAGAQVTWGSGGFVNGTGVLQFGQAAGNANSGGGSVDFQNAIELGGSVRTINVDNGTTGTSPAADATLSGNITSTAGGGISKTGTGVLHFSGTNNTGTTTLSLANNGGVVSFASANAIPGSSGATITLGQGAGVYVAGSTNPLTSFVASRLSTSGFGGLLLDTNSSEAIDFSSMGTLGLGAFSYPGGTPVVFSGSLTPASSTYRFSGPQVAAGNLGAVGSAIQSNRNYLQLPRAETLTGTNGTTVNGGNLLLTNWNNYSGATTVSSVAADATGLYMGNASALGTSAVTFGGAAQSNFAVMNGDHILANNFSITQSAGNLVINAGGNTPVASNVGVPNGGMITFTGTVAKGTFAGNIFNRGANTIFLGDITGSANTTWNVSGANGTFSFLTTPSGAALKTFTSATTLADNASLIIDSDRSLGAVPGAAGTNLTLGSAANFTTNASVYLQPGSGAVVLHANRNVAITTSKLPSVRVDGSDSLTISGILSGTTPTGFQKSGSGTLVLKNSNTAAFTSGSGVHIMGGILQLDYANLTGAGPILPATSILTLGSSTAGNFSGPNTLNVSGGSANFTQNFVNTTVTARSANILLANTGGTGTLGLGATLTRSQAGGTLAITTSGAGTKAITLTGGTASTILTDAGGNAFVVFNGTDWAAKDAANTNVVAGSSVAGFYTANTGTTLAGNADLSDTLNATVTLAAPATLTSLRFNEGTTAFTIDTGASNTLVTGGILVGSGTGALNQTIQGTAELRGTAGSAKDLVIYQGNTGGNGTTTGLLTISAPIGNNTAATALTKSGNGTLVLSGANTYTGVTYLNQGVLAVATVTNGGVAGPLGGAATNAAANLFFSGGTLRYTGNADGTTDRGATFNSPSAIEVVNNVNLTFNGTGIAGIAGIQGMLRKTGAGTLTLGGASDNNSLSVIVEAGTLQLGKTAAGVRVVGMVAQAGLIVNNGATARITGAGGDQIFDSGSLVVKGTGVFDLGGFSEAVDSLAGDGVVNNATGANALALTLTLGTTNNNASNIGAYSAAAAAAGLATTGLAHFTGTITDNGTNKIAVAKGGAGSQTFSYSGGTSTYTYSGDTTITSGTLFLRTANLLPTGAGKGNVILVGNTNINGVVVPGTLDIGGFDQSINGLTGGAGSIVTNTPPNSVTANQTNTLTVGNNDQSSTFDGIFQDGYVITPAVSGFRGLLAVTKVGTGTLTLTGTNTNTGAYTINGGRIDLNNAGGNAISAPVTVNTDGTLKLLANAQINDASTVTVAGGVFELNGKTETVGGLVLTSGSVIDTATGGVLSSATTFDLQAGSVSAVLGGTSGLAKTTSGTVTLSAVNTYTGATTTAGSGTVILSSTGAINNSSGITLGGTSKLYVNGSTAAAVGVAVGNGTTLGGSGTVNGTVTASAGAIIEAGHLSNGSLTIDTLNFGGAGVLNLFDIDAGGSASLLNIVTGLTTTSGGGNAVTINATNAGSIANGTYKLIDVGTFAWGSGNNNFVIGTISGLGGRQGAVLSFLDDDGAYVTISGVNPVWTGLQSSEWSTNAIAGPKNWSAGGATDYIDLPTPDTVLFDDTAGGTTTVDISVANVSPNGVTFNNSSLSYTLQGSSGIIGSTSVVKSGTGTLTINNANSFTGGLVINGGVVTLGNASALGTGNALSFGNNVAAGTKLQLNGNNATLTGLTSHATPGSPVVENGHASTASVLTVNLAGSNTYAGVLQDGGTGTLGLTKDGAGTLILTGANTLTGGNTVTAGTLQIGDGGTAGTLTGSTAIATGATLTFNRSDSSTYAGNTSGLGQLTKLGAGTLILTGSAAHTGGTTISAGAVQLGNGGTTGSFAGNIANNGTLIYNRSDASTVAGNISGSGSVNVLAGTMIVTGANTYLGTTTTAVGSTFQIGNGGTTGSLGAGALTNNGTLAFNRSDNVSLSTALTSGALRQMGPGTLILAAAHTYTGGTQIDSGATLQVGNGAAGSMIGFDGAGTNAVTNNGTLAFNRTGTHTWDNATTGSGSLSVVGGTLTLTASNSTSGSTTIAAGATLNVGNGGTTGTFTTGAVSNAGTLVFNRTDGYTLTATNLVTGAGTVTLATSGTVVVATNNQFNTTGALIMGGSNASTTVTTLDLTNGSSAFGSLLVQTNSASANTITLGAGKTLAIAGAMTLGSTTASTTAKLTINGGAGSELTVGGGLFVGRVATGGLVTNLTLNNTDLTVDGAVSIAHTTAAADPTSTVTVAGGSATFNLGGNAMNIGFHAPGATATTGAGSSGTLDLSAATSVSILGTAGSSILLGSNTGSGATGAADATLGVLKLSTSGANTVSAATITLGNSTQSGTAGTQGQIVLGNSTNTFQADTIYVGRQKSQTGAAPAIAADLISFQGSGGALTLSGLTTAKTNLNIGYNDAGNTGTVTRGTMDLTGGSFNGTLGIVSIGYGGVSGNAGGGIGILTIAGGSTTADSIVLATTNTATSAANIQGTLNLNGGTLTMNSGGTGITNGTGTNVGTAVVNLEGGTLDMNAKVIGTNGTTGLVTLNAKSGTLKNLAELNGGGTLTKTTGGTLILEGTNTYTGTTVISAGVLQVGSGVTTGTLGSGAVTNSATLTFNRSNSYTAANDISGTGNVIQAGSGTTILTGGNSYQGGTQFNAGTLQAGSANALGSSGTLSFSGGTLQFSASNTTDYSARISTAASQQVKIDTNGQSVTFATALASSGGSLEKSGTGTLALTGDNTYTGATTVTDGTLQVGNGSTGSTAAGSAVSVNGTSAVLAGTGTVNGTTTVTLGQIKPGDTAGTGEGTLNLAGGLTFAHTAAAIAATLDISGTTTSNEAGDLIHITGALTLDSDSNFLVQITSGGTLTPVLGQSWTLMDWTGLLTLNAWSTGTSFRTGANADLNEGNLDLPDISSSGHLWSISALTDGATGGALSITVVPEPSRALLLFAGLAALLLRRRRPGHSAA